AITGYTVHCVESESRNEGGTNSGDSPIAVTGLTNGMSYDCDVRATNAAGDGENLTIEDLGPNVAPEAPSMTDFVRTAGHGAAATVVPGTNEGTAIDHYRILCSDEDNGSGDKSSEGDSVSVSVDSLLHGDTYHCTVAVHNAVGWSDESDPSDS